MQSVECATTVRGSSEPCNSRSRLFISADTGLSPFYITTQSLKASKCEKSDGVTADSEMIRE